MVFSLLVLTHVSTHQLNVLIFKFVESMAFVKKSAGSLLCVCVCSGSVGCVKGWTCDCLEVVFVACCVCVHVIGRRLSE